MWVPLLALILGFVTLVWSADRFVEGSASTARHFGMPPLLIGMVIVGFGTSAPEMVVSALAACRDCGAGGAIDRVRPKPLLQRYRYRWSSVRCYELASQNKTRATPLTHSGIHKTLTE